jgi:uncharacterized membrane protein YhaH (DUF805 family)
LVKPKIELNDTLLSFNGALGRKTFIMNSMIVGALVWGVIILGVLLTLLKSPIAIGAAVILAVPALIYLTVCSVTIYIRRTRDAFGGHISNNIPAIATLVCCFIPYLNIIAIGILVFKAGPFSRPDLVPPTAKIGQAVYQSNEVTEDRSVSGEIQKLNDLKESGVLSEAQFEEAKVNLLKNYAA